MSGPPTTVAAATADATHEALGDEIAWVRACLERHLDRGATEPPPRPRLSDRLSAVADALGLSPFERDTLLLAAAVELDGAVAELVARSTASSDPRPTFGLALAVVPDGHWDALSPDRPLRHWQLVTLGDGTTVATRRLHVDEPILHHLVGLRMTEGGLRGLTGPLAAVDLAPSQAALAEGLAAAVAASGARVLIHLDGDATAARHGVAALLAAHLGDPQGRLTGRHEPEPLLIDVHALPSPGPDLATVRTLLDRRVLLTGAVPVLRLPDHPPSAGDTALVPARRLLESLAAPFVLAIGTDPGTIAGRAAVRATVAHPRAAERRGIWREELAAADGDVDDDVLAAADQLAHAHRLGAADIRALVRRWHAATDVPAGATANGDEDRPARRLRTAARDFTRAGLGHLAQRLESAVTWHDLVLPAGHLQVLHDLARQVRHRVRVHEEWGFAARTGGGLGITALFTGEPGTGKTLAAQVLANALALDLYRVDLSATVDKYIGETEKNLARIFDAAEASGAVLLFDEADALFGRRGEVRDGHDRYANLEVAYLLQRMEAYRGLAILTTNLRGNLDRAFLRRIRFVLQFPFPDTVHRAEIWRRAFPDDTPLDGVDPDRLARVALTGGSIASIALSAAFAAADDGTAVSPHHLLQAARIDAAKHDRTLTSTEVAALS